MPKSDRLYLGHMLDMAKKIVEKTQYLERASFDVNEDLRIAIAHRIQIFGEAARRVSPATRDAYPELAWRDAIAMRHKIVHDYTEIDDDVVWHTATEDMPKMLAELRRILPPEVEPPD